MTEPAAAPPARPLRWASEELFFEGDAYFDRLFSEAGSARTTLEAETYIFDDDAIGARAEDALARAARGGAIVRLLVDGFGARSWIARRSARLASLGVQIRVYHPLRFWAPREAGEPVHKRSLFWLANRRNHRKTWVIDGAAAYVGSLNVSACHSRRERGGRAWQDAGVRVEGPEIRHLRSAFDHAWARSRALDGAMKWSDRLKAKFTLQESLVRLNFTPRLRRRSLTDFLARIEGARRRIWIANPYLVPAPETLRALRNAKRAGADVKVLVPSTSDVFFMRWVATAFYRPLARAGAEVFEYQPRFIHQKSVIVDDWAAVGTTNMNTRSLLRDLEVDVTISRPENVDLLAQEYEALLRDSALVCMGPLPLWARLKRWFIGALGRAVTTLLRDWI